MPAAPVSTPATQTIVEEESAPPSHRRWFLIGGVALTVIAAITAFVILRNRRIDTPAKMLACLPQTGSTLVYVDVDALRRSGILDLIAGSKAAEEPDYRKFVDGTGFDYRRDLQHLAGAFVGDDAFFVVDGAFDWKKLVAYANAQGGKCNNGLCDVAASTAGRKVSFYELRGGSMALAFSSGEFAALDVAPRPAKGDSPAQNAQPVWISVPGNVLRDSQKLPIGTRSFTSPLAGAEKIIFSIGPQGNDLELRLDVTCASATEASDLLTKLESATNLLRKMIAREHMQANPNDLSGLLTAGSFRREDRYVRGSWPLRKTFVQNLLSGK